jgi:hypothetical protein
MVTNQPLKPIYHTPSPNERVSLYEGEIKLEQSGQNVTAPASIKLNWLPSISIRFEIYDILKYGKEPDTGNVKLEISRLPLSCDAHVSLVSCSYAQDTSGQGLQAQVPLIRGQLLGRPTVFNTPMCDDVLFHLPNFKSYASGRLHLKNDEWDVILDSNDNLSELTKCLDDQGGFALTHVGMLKRVDGKQFDMDQASDKLDALYHFLSFVRGLWCGPLLPIGQATDKVSWQIWDAPRLTPWKHVNSWFFEFEPQDINEAFNGFMKKWADTIWNEPTRLAIHWYIEANIGAGGVEGSIVLIQAALELFSWVYLMEAPSACKPCTAADFANNRKWPASKKIERLLEEMNIPTDIPRELKELQKANIGAKNGPNMFTYIRNRIAHATEEDRRKLSTIPFEARVEAKWLGLWYLELALLRLFGYNRQYYVRFLHGGPADRVAFVPWVKAATRSS